MSRKREYWEQANANLHRSLESLSYPQVQQYLVSQSWPRFLYKFRPLHNEVDLGRLRRILVHSTLWLSSPRHFNDPFDMKARFLVTAPARVRRERFKAILKEQRRTRAEIDKILPSLMTLSDPEVDVRVRETYLKTVNDSGVCSFAGDPRNILMWSHYASNHQGLCLVFDIARDPKTFLGALEVDYSDEYPVINWVTDFRKARVITSIVLRKHKGWAYEKERRLIEPDRADQSFEFRPEALRAIIIGCSMADETLKP